MYAWIMGFVIILFIALAYIGNTTEGFTTLDIGTATAQRQMLKMEGERQYNNMARLQNPQTTLPAERVDAAFNQAIPVETSRSESLMGLLGYTNLGAADDRTGKVGWGVEQTGMVQSKIDFCESLTTVNCDMMSDPRFAECGFCHRDGVNSKGKKHRGGMYISSDAQIRANEVSTANGNVKAIYKPTIGTCKPANFTVMKDSCTQKELYLQCQAAGAATSKNNCGQCFGATTDGSTGLLYVGPKNRSYAAILHVSHPGGHSANGKGLSVVYPNGYAATLSASTKKLLDPQELPLTIMEGQPLTIIVQGVPAVWCGWISSPDGNRSVSLDIAAQSVQPAAGFTLLGDKRSLKVNKAMTAADSAVWSTFQQQVPNSVLWYQRRNEVVNGIVTKAWYGTGPNTSMDVTDAVKYAAGTGLNIPVTNGNFGNDPVPGVPKNLWIQQDTGKTVIAPEGGGVAASQIVNTLVMTIVVPATLIDPPTSDDKAACPTGPIVFTEIGAGIMGSNSCFAVDGTFNPSVSCIQRLFQAAGGTAQGKLYPKTADAAKALAQKDPSTGALSLDATMAYFNTQSNIAIYGVDMNGAPQPFAVVKAAALAMLGINMNNPCDGPNQASGPHSAECLDYLWRTSGSAHPPNGDPANIPYEYCGPAGQAAPLNANGSVNQANVETANAKGAIPAIRQYYQRFYDSSQDSSDFYSQASAMRSCFNVNITKPKEDPDACPVPNPDEWQCFGPQKLKKPEVFYVNPGGYNTPQGSAPDVCSNFGARVATTEEVAAAQQQGADWCATGWVSDDANAKYPITTSTGQGCGNGSAGVKTWTPDSKLAGVNCFGKKPREGTQDVSAFNKAQWYNPLSLPPGISDASTFVCKETPFSNISCATNGGNLYVYPNEDQCKAQLPAINANPGTRGVSINSPNPLMAISIDQYVRGRV